MPAYKNSIYVYCFVLSNFRKDRYI